VNRSLVMLSVVLVGCLRKAPAPPREQPLPSPPPIRDLVIEREGEPRESSGLVLGRVAGDLHAWVADEDDQAIVEVETSTGRVVAATSVGSRPRDLAVMRDGTLLATLPDANAVARFARTPEGALRETARKPVMLEPLAMAWPEDAATLYVTTGAGHALVALDGATLAERRRWELRREPRGALVEGDRVLVAHAGDSALSAISLHADARDVERLEIGILPSCDDSLSGCSRGRIARHAHALVRTDGEIVVPAVQMQPNPPAFFGASLPPMPQQLDFVPQRKDAAPGPIVGYGIGRGGSSAPAFSSLARIDGKRVSVTRRSTCLEPRAATFVRGNVVIACRGSARLELFGPKGSSRVAVGAGPTAVAATRDASALYVWSALSRELDELEVHDDTLVLERRRTVPRRIERDPDWLRGRELFMTNDDPRIAQDGRTCATCHIEGRDDGITWQTPAGPRRTRTLAGQLDRAPYGWRGEHETLEAHVKTTFRQLGGNGLPPKELAALLTYVRSLPPPPALPSPEDRGRALFAEAECANCHADRTGDRDVHDVGTGGRFMTPTLAGIGSRHVLMHDGRYASLDELLQKSTAMGGGAFLSEDDRASLVRYLRTL
jgi:hypothetical protein